MLDEISSSRQEEYLASVMANPLGAIVGIGFTVLRKK